MTISKPVALDLKYNADLHGLSGVVRGYLFNFGFSAAFLYRIAHRNWKRRSPMARLVGKLAWMKLVRKHGCYISPLAKIGPGLRLPHPVGIVVGDDVTVGENVTIYQHVTLGRGGAADARYPVVEDDVTIYAGAVILGPVTIGKGSVIGANSVVTKDVPPGSVAKGVPARF